MTRYFDKVVYVSQEYVRAVEQLQESEDEQLTALVEALPQLVRFVLPALIVLGHLLTNLFNYILVRRYCQRSQPPLPLDPPDLTCWRASDYLMWVFLASGATLLVPIDLVSTIGCKRLARDAGGLSLAGPRDCAVLGTTSAVTHGCAVSHDNHGLSHCWPSLCDRVYGRRPV